MPARLGDGQGRADTGTPVASAVAAAPPRAQQGVFESVLVRRGRPILLGPHLDRLAASCRELFGADPPPEASETVAAALVAASGTDPAEHPDRAVLRVLIRPAPEDAGSGVIGRAWLTELGARVEATALRLASRPGHRWEHKWVDRTALTEAERLTSPALPYFLDARGLLAEMSRGNLFFVDADGAWATPALGPELLPGVTRRVVLGLLHEWRIGVVERACEVEEFRAAPAAFWTSSSSGAVLITEVDRHPLGGAKVEKSVADLVPRLNAALGVG